MSLKGIRKTDGTAEYIYTDDTLSEENAPGEAKAAGDRIAGVEGRVTTLETAAPEIISNATKDWLDDNVTPTGSAVAIDSSLTQSGLAADAKAAGDAVNDLKSDITKITGYESISFTNGKYIKTNLNTGDTVDLNPVTGYSTNNYAIVDAQEGDKFTINANGGNTGRLWCFVDSSSKLISVADSNATATNLVLTAPASTSKLIINPVTGYGDIYKGEYLVDAVNDLSADVDTLKSELSNSALSEKTDSKYWESGGITQADGSLVSNVARLRTSVFFPVPTFTSFKTIGDYSCCVYAWDNNGNYLGVLKTSGEFEKSTTNIAWVTGYCFVKNAGYSYKLVMRKTSNPSATLTVADGLHCIFYYNEISELSELGKNAIYREISTSEVERGQFAYIKELQENEKSIQENIQENSLAITELAKNMADKKESFFVGFDGTLVDANGALFVGSTLTLSKNIVDEILPYSYITLFPKLGFDDWSVPILNLVNVKEELLAVDANKSIEQSASKGDSTIDYTFMGKSGTIKKMKVQGSSSVAFPKKNYTLTFSENIVFGDWESNNKFVIKSNFNDFSQARNVCCAKLWGDIAKSRSIAARTDILVDSQTNTFVSSSGASLRGTATPPFNIGGNYGAIDGFPILVTINGEYWGLYAFNIPKDAIMASMDGTGKEAIVSCGGYSSTQADYFNGHATMQPDQNGVTDFEVEFSSDDLSENEILASINRAIDAAMDSYNTDEERLATINQYVDIDSATDYFILSCLINNTDGIGKNYLLDTWDGTKWYFVPYDMDMVFGNDKWSGTHIGSPTSGLTFASINSMHRLFHVIYRYDTARFINRYKELRAGALSEQNVYIKFGDYINRISRSSYDYEVLRWIDTPGSSVKDFNQIVNWYRMRCQYLDAEISALAETI